MLVKQTLKIAIHDTDLIERIRLVAKEKATSENHAIYIAFAKKCCIELENPDKEYRKALLNKAYRVLFIQGLIQKYTK